MLTCGKSILLHCVPVVQESKSAVPIWAPEGTDCTAIQFTSAVPLEPSPYSETQVVNWFWSSNSTQMAAPLPRVGLLSIEWPNEANTFTFFPPLKGWENDIFLQANSPGLDVVTLSFPALKLAAIKGDNRQSLAKTEDFFVVSLLTNKTILRYCTVHPWVTKQELQFKLIQNDNKGSQVTINCKKCNICFQQRFKDLKLSPKTLFSSDKFHSDLLPPHPQIFCYSFSYN